MKGVMGRSDFPVDNFRYMMSLDKLRICYHCLGKGAYDQSMFFE